MLKLLALQAFVEGYNSSSAKTSVGNFMADGSTNTLIVGNGKTQICKGFTIKGGVTGSQVLMNAGDAYAGLGNKTEEGLGSVFKVLGALFYIGTGTLYYNGTSTGTSATTTLKLKKFTSGSLGTEYQVGMAQPSAPVIFAVTAPSGYTGKNDGAVSVKIARVRSATGGVSNASLSSNIVTATSQSIAVTFPSADSNGQDYWEVDVTKNAEGALGNHFFLEEIAESTLTATITATATLDSDATIGLPNGTLTSSNIGWQYTSSGDTTTYVTAVGANDSHSAGKQQITLAAASVITGSQSATFTKAVAGVLRTHVFEWYDADIIAADLAPIRNFPPPAALFGGVMGDVTFVDGAYGDTVNMVAKTATVSTTYRGNAIAISDSAKPESYPPDNFIFTGDGPTAVVPGGDGITWRFAKNSLGVIRYQGGSPALSYERVWTGIGVLSQNSVTLGTGGRLYAYTGQRGAVRLGLGGEPDTLFAAPVADDLAGFTGTVVLGTDTNHNYVFYGAEQTLLAFYEPLEVWCAPINTLAITGFGYAIRSIVTVNGSAYLCYSDGVTSIDLYDFNIGSGTQSKVTTPWLSSTEVSDIISRVGISGRFDTASNDVTVKVFTNGNYSTPKSNQTIDISSTGYQPLGILKPNVRMAKKYRIELSYTSAGGDAGFDDVRIEGESQNIIW